MNDFPLWVIDNFSGHRGDPGRLAWLFKRLRGWPPMGRPPGQLREALAYTGAPSSTLRVFDKLLRKYWRQDGRKPNF